MINNALFLRYYMNHGRQLDLKQNSAMLIRVYKYNVD